MIEFTTQNYPDRTFRAFAELDGEILETSDFRFDFYNRNDAIDSCKQRFYTRFLEHYGITHKSDRNFFDGIDFQDPEAVREAEINNSILANANDFFSRFQRVDETYLHPTQLPISNN